MDGYDSATYGDRFAEVYDDWYGAITDTAASVDTLAELADGRPVLELGVGTGRLAVPLAERGLQVTGVDTSRAMLDRLAAKGGQVTAVVGDMTDPPLGDERFGLVVIAYNTLFNLVDPTDQARCLSNAAGRLHAQGILVIEAFVPQPEARPIDTVEPREVAADKVVLSVSRSRPESQEVLGQYIDITEGGIALRPWHIRWSTPAQIDQMASEAGLDLSDRWADWARTPFDDTSVSHISMYRARESEQLFDRG